jgi:hypothetical protein
VKVPSLLALARLAVLALMPAAGPPEGMSGRMALDEVADGLRKYQKEKDAKRRRAWLERLAQTRDVRVAVALGEAMGDADLREAPYHLMLLHFASDLTGDGQGLLAEVARWWGKNEADLRRRAKELPR